ncbi:hypothetical protein VTH06DRAFT_3946 [Thermothelomyces fergusii]
MSGYGIPGSGESEANPKFESLLAQLRLQSSPSPGPGAGSGPDYSGQFHYHHSHQPFYAHPPNSNSPNLPAHNQEPLDPPTFLPEAPTPPVTFSHPQFPPGILNQMAAPRGGGTAGADGRTVHLLNLLKFSGQGSSANSHQSASHEAPKSFASAPIASPVIHAPAPAAADPTGLLAALMKGNLQPEIPKHEPSSLSWNRASPPSETQQYLLNLLNRPKPSQHDTEGPSEPSLLTPPPATDDPKDTESSHGGRSAEPTLVGTLASRSEFDFETKNIESPPKLDSTPHSQLSQQSGTRQAGVFSHSDHFDNLPASSPAQHTPKSSTTPGASGSTPGGGHPPSVPTQSFKQPDAAPSSHDQNRPLSGHGAVGSAEQDRPKPEHPASPPQQSNISRPSNSNLAVSNAVGMPPSTAAGGDQGRSEESKESVAEAVSGLAQRVDREVTEALTRAGQEQVKVEPNHTPEHPATTENREEYSKPSQGVHSAAGEKSLEEERPLKEDTAFLNSALAQDLAQGHKESGNDSAQAAHGPVADSWESAEAEEVAVNDETAAPVKVFNFPLKPWITISLQEIDDSRPVFREEAILDIARLKKDFDQIDRNLVSASETYMAYGMSKAGGLRVIRQEDGKDAKLFTDTQDRIFNVAISTSPSHQPAQEAIIGTGVSGTVYWVQLKTGDRDHLEDAHPEQYGFALPPISTQEGGDAPGGVLKTRARPSAMHPEFFAVGRGKYINIIWPAFIFANDLFKSGHDRVVDTEKLLKQCSLKINTGKAGKDFIFSQDDTLVVSLDKSGRVKFWDVRDLTAMKEGSDQLHPMPARTSLEIKEPLMTLTTTPEGEKAWPTSVLLLDKFRPYQKRTALRYMIVGMKQNHTLQLWDLALGKPVQEFNFPHNKESDAVCSVMYHAPTSMIVVGHPTRNSIYFLHFSAPKYSLKNLSQVDYIQRLVAQDSSIPQPESTAVISGIREYSFANKGVLRSLNILENPAASGDGEEPTLFELYAMHSKGVTCLFIKQSELGWTKDNKVIAPVDAVEVGLAKISKLIAPPPPPPDTHHGSGSGETTTTPQIRIATRGGKDTMAKTAPPQGDDKKGSDSVSLPKFERKEEGELPGPAPEKTEKKGRKRKAGTAAASGDQPVSNGAVESNRASSQGKARKDARNVDSPADAASNKPASDHWLTSAAFQEQLDAVVGKMESRIVSNLSGRFDAVFNDIFKQMQQFQDNRDSAFASNQSALLAMVADVLNNNTEAVLKNLIIAQIENSVIPSVHSAIDKSVSEQLSAKSITQVNAMQREIQRLLPGAVNQAMQKPELIRSISDKISHSINGQVEAQITKSLHVLAPTIAKTTAQTVHQRIMEDVGVRISEAFEQLDQRRRAEDAKLDRLIAQTQDLSNAISSLTASQVQLQQELAALKQQIYGQGRERMSAGDDHGRSHPQSRSASGPRGLASIESRELVNYPSQQQQQQQQQQHQSPASHQQPVPAPSFSHPHQHQQPHQHQRQFGNQEGQMAFAPLGREDRQKMELDNLMETIDGLMRSGNYDEAMLRWLHSGDRAEEIFQQVLSNYNPIFVRDLQPLILLSVGATVSVDLNRNSQKLMKKVNLLEVVIYAFNQTLGTLDDQVREVTPKIMNILKTRIEQLFLEISRIAPHDPALKTLSNMSQVAGRIAETVQMRHGPVHASAHVGVPY